MDYPFGARFQFHPVGQGLFASGDIGQYQHGLWMGMGPNIKFDWVYDCGTTSEQALVEVAIGNLCADRSDQADLGLVVLSHFDKDHISGIVRLLQRKKVGILLLPYVPLCDRILIGLHEGAEADEPLMRFLLNPVRYLRGADVKGIGRVLFVPPSRGRAIDGGEPDDRPDQDATEDPPSRDSDAWDLDYEVEENPPPASGDDGDPALAPPDGAIASVAMLAEGQNLRLKNLWEFVPYNDAEHRAKATGAFTSQARQDADELVNATTDVAREAALAKLKCLYDKTFGKSGQARNEISLFLYGGPLAAGRFRTEGRLNGYLGYGIGMWKCFYDDPGKGAVLYCGDGYLDNDLRLKSLIDYLGPHRIERTCVFQVMHHGALNNWHQGVAAAIGAPVNVFCSDPHHKKLGHPHAEVLRDFWPWGAIQVDKRCDAQFHVWPLK
ncbi:hypothetical protein [Pseudomonas sp. CGJS7]|uniref:hypothetical protein n=1 Tax=Pseudomonas sp. CGJS7 TaxID=3109348 RepID=UPI00300BF69D